MGLKLELLIIILASAVLITAMTVEISSSPNLTNSQAVEMEFTDTVLREVDNNKSLSVSHGRYGIRESGILTIHNLRYHTDSIKLLKAKRGIFKGDDIYLDHNVTVNKEKGSDYYTEHAVYNQKTGILNVTAPFLAIMGKNIMHGNTLRYDTNKKEAFATQVDAVVYTNEK